MKAITLLSVFGMAITAGKVNAACWSQSLGYNCCSTTTSTVEIDNDGKWGVENGQWCGIVEQQSGNCWSERLGFKCCSNNYTPVVYTDIDGKWGVENDQWCGISSGTPASTTTKKTTTTTKTTTKTSSPTPTYPKGQGCQFFQKCKNPKHWALTYDDGAYAAHDQKLLDLLKQYNIKATFFLCGNLYQNINTAQSEASIKRMYNEGHVVAVHTYSHQDLTGMNSSQIANEMNQVNDAIYKYTGRKPAFMRPPYGSTNQNVLNTLGSLGYTAAINWNVDPMDYSNGGDINYAKNVLNQAKGQPVISLNHLNFGGATPDKVIALAKAEIDLMLANGYTPVTMEECLGISAYQN